MWMNYAVTGNYNLNNNASPAFQRKLTAFLKSEWGADVSYVFMIGGMSDQSNSMKNAYSAMSRKRI